MGRFTRENNLTAVKTVLPESFSFFIHFYLFFTYNTAEILKTLKIFFKKITYFWLQPRCVFFAFYQSLQMFFTSLEQIKKASVFIGQKTALLNRAQKPQG
jgi:hypothetical protein